MSRKEVTDKEIKDLERAQREAEKAGAKILAKDLKLQIKGQHWLSKQD